MTKLSPSDALGVMLMDLANEAMKLKPWMCDEREQWYANSRQLLEAVKDPVTRLAWRMTLAQSLACGMEGFPVGLVMKELSDGAH